MTSPISSNNDASLLTLPLDLLKHITNKLDARDEKALKLTCKRMNFLIVRPPHLHHHHHLLPQEGGGDEEEDNDPHSSFLTVGVSRDLIPRDGRSTPIPQSPLPYKAAATLQELELENREVEEREAGRGMELSDDEDAASAVSSSFRGGNGTTTTTTIDKPNRKKYKVKKNILHWTAELDSAPSSPGGPGGAAAAAGHGGGFVHSPRAATGSSSPALPTFTLTIQ